MALTRDPWEDWVRVTDHHWIMHLARLDMIPGSVLCGSPPIGCQLSDPIGQIALPGDRTPTHDAVCRYCAAIATPHHLMPTPPVAVETLFDDLDH